MGKRKKTFKTTRTKKAERKKTTKRNKKKRDRRNEPAYSPTAYDDALRTMVNDCQELLYPLINELFGESYTGEEKIIYTPNEHFLGQQDGKSQNRITDTAFKILGTIPKSYHLECQSTEDRQLLIRIFEYDAQIALDQNSEITGETIIVTFPHTGVIYLRSSTTTPETMHILLRTAEGETGYDVPVLKMRDYSIDEIFEKHLLFLIPFYLFNFEKQFPELDANPEKLAALRAEYVRIQDRLEQLVQDGNLLELTKKTIMENAAHVLALLAKNHAAIGKEMKPVMVGRVLDYEAKRIHNAAWNKAWDKGTKNGIAIGETNTLSNQIRKKVARNKSFDTIVDECESTPEIIRPLYDRILAEAQNPGEKDS